MTGRFLIDVFDDFFDEATVSKDRDDLEKAILAVRAARQLICDEPEHTKEVEAELVRVGDALQVVYLVLVKAHRHFDQLSPRARIAAGAVNTQIRAILLKLVFALDGKQGL